MYKRTPIDYAHSLRMMNFSQVICAEIRAAERENGSFILQSLLMLRAVKNVRRLNSQIVNVSQTKARRWMYPEFLWFYSIYQWYKRGLNSVCIYSIISFYTCIAKKKMFCDIKIYRNSYILSLKSSKKKKERKKNRSLSISIWKYCV